MNATNMQNVLAACIAACRPVLIKGAPGIGKSDIVYQATTQAAADLLIVYCATSDLTDPKGIPATWYDNSQGKQVADFVPFGFLQKMIDATRPLVVFFDDLGLAVPAVQGAFMNLILARRTGDGTKISDFVTFVAATNRREDKAGVAGLLEPVKSRFATILQLEVDVDDWIKWALSVDLPIELIGFIKYRPELLHKFVPSADLVNSPSPRTVANLGALLNMKLPPVVELEAYTGCVGEGFAAEFIGFLKIFRELPNPDVVLMDPEAVKVPTNPAVLYALCGALARKATENNMDRVLKFADRLGDEFNVLLVRDAVRKNQAVCTTKAYIQWAAKHADVMC